MPTIIPIRNAITIMDRFRETLPNKIRAGLVLPRRGAARNPQVDKLIEAHPIPYNIVVGFLLSSRLVRIVSGFLPETFSGNLQ